MQVPGEGKNSSRCCERAGVGCAGIFLVLAVYGKKEAGRDLSGLCKDCGWQREGGNKKETC